MIILLFLQYDFTGHIIFFKLAYTKCNKHIVFINDSIYSRGGFIQDGISLKLIQNLNSG